jgi:hypothetical protein
VSSQTFQPGPLPRGMSEPPSFPSVGVAPQRVAPPAYVAPEASPMYLPGQILGTDPWAVVAFVTSLLGLGLVAVISGHVAVGRISVSGRQGRGLAIAGLVLGYLSMAASVVAVAWFYLGFRFGS